MQTALRLASQLRAAVSLGIWAAIITGATAAAQPQSPPGDLQIRVILSAAAARALTLRSEAITVAAAFYGDPIPRARRYADEAGRIPLLNREVTLPAVAGTARFNPRDIPQRLRARIQGPVMVNVNVYSARRSGPDNLLACDFLDGALPNARRMPIALHCALITEGTEPRYVS